MFVQVLKWFVRYRFISAGDWFTSIDLTDAYFHIPVYPPHWKYLRFAFQGIAYESLRVFIKCTEAAVAPFMEAGIRVATYIDDCLMAAPICEEVACHKYALTRHQVYLGFQINVEKTTMMLVQHITLIGLTLDSLQAKAFLSPERVGTMLTNLALLRRGKVVTLRQCQRLLGLMASSVVAKPLGH